MRPWLFWSLSVPEGPESAAVANCLERCQRPVGRLCGRNQVALLAFAAYSTSAFVPVVLQRLDDQGGHVGAAVGGLDLQPVVQISRDPALQFCGVLLGGAFDE